MTQPMDHATCSRLLPTFLAGQAGDATQAITEHLRGCARCRAERAGLERLLAPVEPPTETERARLRAAVQDATFGATQAPQQVRPLHAAPSDRAGSATPSPGRRYGGRPGWQRSWVTPALGAAAAVLLIVSGISLFGHSTSNLSAGSNSGGGVSEANRVARPSPGAAHNATAAGPAPSFYRGHPIELGQVSKRASSVLIAYARGYSSGHDGSLGTDLLTRLAAQAPRSLRPQIRRCGDRVLDDHHSALPAFGAVARVRRRPGLVLVFTSRDPSTGSHSRFGLYAWSRGSCRILLHRTGPVR